MKTSKARCQVCGWWDIGMKYGPQRRCTQCGAPVTRKEGSATQRPLPMATTLEK